MVKENTAILIIFPFLAALCCYVFRSSTVRSFIVLTTGCVLAVSAIFLIPMTPFSIAAPALPGPGIHAIIRILDFLLLLIILYFGFKHHSLTIIILAAFQIVLMAYFEFFLISGDAAVTTIYCDYLYLIMVLIISIVGSIICFQALPYMKNHETHLQLTKTGQHRFFFVMILFLGAMNGLVLSNDMLIFYFFFEVTTLCSFLLIGHDETETAIKNAVRALWMNSLGEIGVKVKGRPEGETVARTEQPHGELLYYIKADGSKNLDRLRIRTPSFANIPALVTMLPGQYLSDVPVIVLSIDPCISCTER